MVKRSNAPHGRVVKRRRLISLTPGDDNGLETVHSAQNTFDVQSQIRSSQATGDVHNSVDIDYELDSQPKVVPGSRRELDIPEQEKALLEEEEDDEDRITPVYPDPRRQRSMPSQSKSSDKYENQNDNASEENEGFGGGGGGREEEEEDDDDDDDDESDTPARAMRDSGFSSSGILSSIRLDRFMSHTCFVYDLGPNVNIVNGANGSGKSAIVAALQLGLGARPSLTERGSRVEDHIKHGESSAVITINILNRKSPHNIDLTYKHDIYGDMITIERKMIRGKHGKAGTSTWIVKGKKRNIKLPNGVTHRKEIMDIVDHFGFMVHNPVAILTQTKSKAFLAKGKPAHHYKLYREATLLEPLQNELIETVNVIKSVARLIRTSEQKQPSVVKQLEKLEAAHRDAQEMKNIHTRIRDAVTLLAWTEHSEEEHNLKVRIETTQAKFEPEEERARQKLNEESAKCDSIKEKSNEVQEELEQLAQKMKYASDARRDAQVQLTRAKTEATSIKSRIEEFNRDFRDADARIERVGIRMERARTEHFKGQEQKSLLVEELTQLTEEEKKIKEDMELAREEKNSFEDKRMTMSEELRALQEQSRRLEMDRENKMREYVHIENVSRDRNNLERFGRYVPSLLDSIKRNLHKFEFPPVGPVGQFIKLEDESWAATIEQAIQKAHLCGFIVGNARDQNLLLSFVPRPGPRPFVLVTNMHPARYSVSSNMVPDVHRFGCKTILDLVTVQNDVVYNALIDFCQIEQTVLAEKGDITNLAWSHSSNVGQVWNKAGERAYSVRGSKVFRSTPRSFGAFFLTKDMSRFLESLKKEVDDLAADSETCKHKASASQSSLFELQRDAVKVRQRIEENEQKRLELERRRQLIEDQLSRAEDAFDPTPFEREIEEMKSQKEDCMRQLSRYKEDLKEINKKCLDCQEASEESRRQLAKANSEYETVSRKLEEYVNQAGRAKVRLRAAKRTHEEASAKLDRANAELDKRREKVAERLEMAAEAGPRPETVDFVNMPSEKVKRKVDMYRTRLRTEQQRRGGKSADEIEMEYLKASKQHEDNLEKMVRVKGYQKSLQKGIRMRENNLRRLEKTLKKMVRSKFRMFLGTRNHDGNITFQSNGDTKELVISVKMASHGKGDGERFETVDLRSLSGGERSFTTLCFMMALAEICQNPIRVMDEIDVFQDEANRRVSFRNLVDFFQNYLSERQVIIITPHSLPNINPSPACRIVKLAAPRNDSSRGHQTQIDDFIDSVN